MKTNLELHVTGSDLSDLSYSMMDYLEDQFDFHHPELTDVEKCLSAAGASFVTACRLMKIAGATPDDAIDLFKIAVQVNFTAKGD